MAKRPDISDFDYGSVVDQIRGQTRRSRPSFLKRNSGRIIDTLIGITDNYQTYKLREKMDNANFENNLELAKLRADAANQIKRNKETSGQYQSLVNNGYQFDDPSKGTQQNLQAARKVFGEQAWGTVVSQFPNLLPRASFKSYEDYEAQRNTWGMSDENHKAVENLYNSVVMDKVNYVRSGQAFDFEKFQTNLKSLENMGISIDPDNYGLMSKIGGKLARKLDYQQEQIAAFRNRYLTAEVTKGVEAMEAWTGSTTPEEYYEAVKDTDLGIWASLPQEDAALLTQLAPGLKTEATEALQKLMHKNPNTSSVQIRETLDSILFGNAGRTPSTAQFTLAESQERKRINADTTLSEEEKIKAREETSRFYDNLKVTYSTSSEEESVKLIGTHKFLKSVEEKIKPLLIKKQEGTLTSQEKQRLKDLQIMQETATSSIDFIGLPSVQADYFAEQRINRMKLGFIDEAADAHINVFFSKPQNTKNPETSPSVLFTTEDVQEIVTKDPTLEEPEFNRLMLKAVKPLEFFDLNQSAVNNLLNNLTSEVRYFSGRALQEPNIMQSIFNTNDEELIEKYRTFLGPTPATDKGGAKLSLNMSQMANYRFNAQQVFTLSEEAVSKGQPGFFHGQLISGDIAGKLNEDTEDLQRQLMMRVFIENFTTIDPETKAIVVKPSSLNEVANALYTKFLSVKELAQPPSTIDATATDKELRTQAIQFNATQDFSSVEKIEKILEARQQERDEIKQQENSPAAIRARNFEALFGIKPGSGVLKTLFPALRDEETSDIPNERLPNISDEDNENISEIVNSVINLKTFIPNEEGLQSLENKMIQAGYDKSIIDRVLVDIRSKKDN